ncbi:MAG TPA: lysine--tRNA ligase [Candidatus Saccharimonadales bacterium]|nr:lysine--tRNA ligase [Candidatus Saccharimonadales bacterium]
MIWADEILKSRKGVEVINDSWTPSGIVHMGSLKGPVIHDTLFRVLKKKGTNVKYIYGFDDADPIDGLSPDLIDSHSKYLGVPISVAPSPDGNGSFSDYFSRKMKRLFKELGIEAQIYRTSEIYKNGKFNDAIRFVLDHAEDIRNVYSQIYKKEVAGDWYPLQVVCPKCGKLGTTKVIGWDGKVVVYECSKTLVKWAEGCGQSGKISPFDGNGKMPWKVEWAGKWWTFGVTIEGAGKDHASAGGSYDVAREIFAKVFKKELPLKLAYEFFLSGGKKMSSSKGTGMTGEELLEVLSPEIARFLMIRTAPNRAVEFTPRDTLIIPTLYDEYQKAAGAYVGKTDEELARIFELSQIKDIKKPPSIRFSVLAQWVQMPNMEAKIEEEGLHEWAKYAKVWIEKYAPESEKFLIQQSLPDQVKSLTDKQKEMLKKIAGELDSAEDAEEFQTKIYEIGKEIGLNGKETFAAIYTSLIGKDHGPKAAWLILSLDKDFVKKRFQEV